ncbi:hypothetical protein F4861DRAFT_439721 [Xylaria intraflava]|nr:hypothetical protein F4861DRAFT_439721 [Xylaria intraflava]
MRYIMICILRSPYIGPAGRAGSAGNAGNWELETGNWECSASRPHLRRSEWFGWRPSPARSAPASPDLADIPTEKSEPRGPQSNVGPHFISSFSVLPRCLGRECACLAPSCPSHLTCDGITHRTPCMAPIATGVDATASVKLISHTLWSVCLYEVSLTCARRARSRDVDGVAMYTAPVIYSTASHPCSSATSATSAISLVFSTSSYSVTRRRRECSNCIPTPCLYYLQVSGYLPHRRDFNSAPSLLHAPCFSICSVRT